MYVILCDHRPATIGHRIAGAALLAAVTVAIALCVVALVSAPACARSHHSTHRASHRGHGHPSRRTTEVIVRWSKH